jgi:lipoprotein NlpD
MLGCATTEPTGPALYVVQPQDTLYSVAWRHNLDYHDLARWNRLSTDFKITVGQSLRLGPTRTGAEPSAATVPGGAPASGIAAHGARELPRPLRPSSSAPPPASIAGVPIAHLEWVWPTDRSVPPRPVQSGGIAFPGRLGQAVRAAAAGRVVYTGSGIRGYGQLIIIKHSDSLLSAYAYNRAVTVKEGQEVKAGQTIAEMGVGAQQAPSLYFEIRLNGKPIDPLPFLLNKK